MDYHVIANKIMSKYQRPVCILTHTGESYQGSARGCDKVDVNDFKKICQQTNVTEYTIGHPGAFGLCIKEDNIEQFINATDEALKDMPNEAVYYVDYIFEGENIDGKTILDIADLEYYWGKDVDESLVAVKGLKVTSDMVTVYNNRTITIKINVNDISLMIFNASETDYKVLQENNIGYVEINLVGTCQKNEWMNQNTPQIFITEYEVINSSKYFF